MKIRTSRWNHREYLKECSNRRGVYVDQHPQVRRQIDEEQVQREEYVRGELQAQEQSIIEIVVEAE